MVKNENIYKECMLKNTIKEIIAIKVARVLGMISQKI